MGKRVRDFRYEDDPRMAPIRRYLWKEVCRDTKEGLPEDVCYWLWADHILDLADRASPSGAEQTQVEGVIECGGAKARKTTALTNVALRNAAISGRIVLVRMGAKSNVALETRDAMNEFWQALVSFSFEGKMPDIGASVEVSFGGGDEQFRLVLERVPGKGGTP